jgi:hypothetical protein
MNHGAASACDSQSAQPHSLEISFVVEMEQPHAKHAVPATPLWCAAFAKSIADSGGCVSYCAYPREKHTAFVAPWPVDWDEYGPSPELVSDKHRPCEHRVETSYYKTGRDKPYLAWTLTDAFENTRCAEMVFCEDYWKKDGGKSRRFWVCDPVFYATRFFAHGLDRTLPGHAKSPWKATHDMLRWTHPTKFLADIDIKSSHITLQHFADFIELFVAASIRCIRSRFAIAVTRADFEVCNMHCPAEHKYSAHVILARDDVLFGSLDDLRAFMYLIGSAIVYSEVVRLARTNATLKLSRCRSEDNAATLQATSSPVLLICYTGFFDRRIYDPNHTLRSYHGTKLEETARQNSWARTKHHVHELSHADYDAARMLAWMPQFSALIHKQQHSRLHAHGTPLDRAVWKNMDNSCREKLKILYFKQESADLCQLEFLHILDRIFNPATRVPGRDRISLLHLKSSCCEGTRPSRSKWVAVDVGPDERKRIIEIFAHYENTNQNIRVFEKGRRSGATTVKVVGEKRCRQKDDADRAFKRRKAEEHLVFENRTPHHALLVTRCLVALEDGGCCIELRGGICPIYGDHGHRGNNDGGAPRSVCFYADSKTNDVYVYCFADKCGAYEATISIDHGLRLELEAMRVRWTAAQKRGTCHASPRQPPQATSRQPNKTCKAVASNQQDSGPELCVDRRAQAVLPGVHKTY